MYFIEKENAAVGLFHQTGLILISTRKGVACMAKQLGQQQLGIIIVISTVKSDEGIGSFVFFLYMHSISMHSCCKSRFADTAFAKNQRMQSLRWINYSRLGLVSSFFQTALMPQKLIEGIFLFTVHSRQEFFKCIGFLFFQTIILTES